jgi:hypothetical protein
MSIRSAQNLAILVLAGWCAFATAVAEISEDQARAVAGRVFNALDCDINGFVEPNEVDDHFAQLWHPIDVDRSRSLNPREYAMTHDKLDDAAASALFVDADTNSDGEVSPREFGDHLRRVIVLLDTDGDNEISRADAGVKPFPTFKARRFSLSQPRAGDS